MRCALRVLAFCSTTSFVAAGCGPSNFFSGPVPVLASPSAVPSGSTARASIAEFSVFDGVCGNLPDPCAGSIPRLVPDGSGSYQVRNTDRRVTTDVVVANPRVLNRYLKLVVTFSFEPRSVSGTDALPEFGVAYGEQSAIRLRFFWGTWPIGGRTTFTLSETGPDMPATGNSIVVDLPFTATVDPGKPGPELFAGSCDFESGALSIGGYGPSSILFTNASSAPRKIFWLDAAGRRQLINTLAPQAAYTQSTAYSQAWLVADESDRCLALYRTEYGPTMVTIR